MTIGVWTDTACFGTLNFLFLIQCLPCLSYLVVSRFELEGQECLIITRQVLRKVIFCHINRHYYRKGGVFFL